MKELPISISKRIDFTETCWLWKPAKEKNGYAKIYVKGIVKTCHRFSWKFFNGEIPEGMLVCHTCDVRHCMNPNHLFLGTNKDNLSDMASKGRSARFENHGSKTHPETTKRGEKHGRAKLTRAQVSEIREKYVKVVYSANKLSREYGVSKVNILAIVNNKIWKEELF